MKKILLTAVLLSALTAAQAHRRHSAHTTPVAPAATATSAKDDIVIYIGTNEFYLELEREGVSRG